MKNLPTKRPPGEPTEIDSTPSWRELGERVRDLLKDISAEVGATWRKEGADLERDLQARLLPALQRAKREIEKLIARLEERLAKKR